MKSAFETPRRVGVITAFPPGRNSLNEFGFHLVTHMAQNDELDRVVVFADETDQGAPMQIEGTESVVSWKFNSLTNPIRLYQAVRRARVDSVIVNLQFATFGDTKLAGGVGLLVPLLLAKTGIPTGVILHNLVENVDMEDAGFAENKWIAKPVSYTHLTLPTILLV